LRGCGSDASSIEFRFPGSAALGPLPWVRSPGQLAAPPWIQGKSWGKVWPNYCPRCAARSN